MLRPLCIYHGGCDDGFGAAWVVKKATGDLLDFYPGVYQQEPPDVTDRHVLLVDFSYKRPVLEEMAKRANSIIILDHHDTAQTDLADLPQPQPPNFSGVDYHFDDHHTIWKQKEKINVFAIFDKKRSGAGITWDFFFPNFPRPAFVNYIEDRDLWIKSLPNCDQFIIALRSYPQDFLVWDEIAKNGVDQLIQEGHSIWRYYRQRIEEIKKIAYIARIDGETCWIANAPYFAASEVAGELALHNTATFGACYFEVSKGRWQYSLRSRNEFHVGNFARRFGGGGHQQSAGFTVNKLVHN